MTTGGRALLGATCLAAGCSVPADEPMPRWSDPFCAEVQPSVEAFLGSGEVRNAAVDEARYGGTAVVASVAEMTGGLSPVTSTEIMGRQYQQFAVHTTLVRYDEALTPEPYLARSWEVAPDTSSVTFHLRTDVLWHDGERTDAEDVVFTYRLLTDPESGFPNPAYWEWYDTSPGGIEAVDDSTVRVALQPHVDFLDPWRATAILPEHLLGDVAPSEHATHPYATVCPIGNGPFVFREHRVGDRWVFDANPRFPAGLGGRPYLDRVVHRVIPEQATLLSELLTQGIHVYPAAAPDQAERIAESPGLELVGFSSFEFAFVAWNTRRAPLADARVRRALTMALDRDAIVASTLQGHGSVAHSGVPPRHWAHAPDALGALPYDPERARASLERAGWRDRDGDGVRENAAGVQLAITLKYNQGSRARQQISGIMQAQLAEVGVDARPTVVEASTLGAQVFDPGQRDFDGFLINWIHDFRLDETDFFHSERTGGPWALSGIRNPRIDRLLDTLQVVPDREAARSLWTEYQRLVIQEQPYTYLYFVDRLVGVDRRLRGATMDVRGELVSLRDWWLARGG